MKISLNWIKEFTKVDISVDELVKKIGVQLGAVEEVEDLGAKYKGAVAVKVVTCVDHPNADKLHVCMIDDGGVTKDVARDGKGLVEVVCGANNIAAGQSVIWLSPGVTVPETYGSSELFVLSAKELRGVMSNGMIASARELDFGDDHDGIIVLEQEVSPGTPIAKIFWLDDYIIDIENKMFTHRPDCFGMLGVAREVAGIQNIKFESPHWYKKSSLELGDGVSKLELIVENKIPDLVPRFMAVAIADVQVKSSPLWLQTFLSRLGVKPINNVVDVTNYMMLLTGQPLHAYDYDKVASKNSDGKARIVVRKQLDKQEELTLLGNKKITIEPKVDSAIIATDSQAIGMGGVMGGAETEVDDKTKNIILECANFDMYAIRKTAMAYGLFTDAVTRFNKGQSVLQNDKVTSKAVEMILDVAGGNVASKIIDDNHSKPNEHVIVSAKFINDRLGLTLNANEMAKILTNVEFSVDVNGDELEITAPFWRTDIAIPEDIVEEVGRLYGYDKLPLELPIKDIKPPKLDAIINLKTQIRNILKSAGANEVLGYSFVHGSLIDKVGQNRDLAYQLSNALSPDLQYYRLSILPSLLEKVHPNVKNGYDEFGLFEIGKVHIKNWLDEEKLPKEEQRLGFVFAVSDKLAKKYEGAAYYHAKKYFTELLDNLNVDVVFKQMPVKADLEVNDQMVAPLSKERSAIVLNKSSGELIGVIGEFNKTVTTGLKLPVYCAGFELDITKLIGNNLSSVYQPISKYPRVEQDITLKVDTKVMYAELYDYLVEQIDVVKPKDCTYKFNTLDIYQPDEKTKNYSFRLIIASHKETLKAKDVNQLLDEIATQTNKKFGAVRV